MKKKNAPTMPATPANPKASAELRCSALLAAVKSWRTAEVHHAALTLELRDGDVGMAKAKLENRTRELRIAADDYLKAANDQAQARRA